MPDRRRVLQWGAASVAAASPIGRAFGQGAWPNRIVKLVVPFTPGGGIDAIGRILGARLSEMWGQQVVVENKPGGATNIASEYVARSAPDGYTLYISSGTISVNKFLFPSLNYDPVADFAPVTLICDYPNLLIVPASSPFRSVADILTAAKANPGKLTFASPGHGSSPHMSAELFKHMAKVDITHIPYRGAAPGYTDLIAGRVDMTFSVMASGLPLVQGGQVRAIGVSTLKRELSAPDVPTIAESGVPDYDTSSWFAFFEPAKTPPEIVRKIYTDTAAALAEPAIKTKLDGLGVNIIGSTPEALGSFLKAEMDKWGPVIKAANIKVSE